MRKFLSSGNAPIWCFGIVIIGMLLAFFKPLSSLIAQPFDEKEACVYVVKKGDTLPRLASEFTGKSANCTQIMQFNALPSDILTINQQLNLPKSLLLRQYQSCELGLPAKILSMPTLSTPASTPSPIPTPIPTLTPPQKKSERKILPEIRGIVFEDTNGDGQQNCGEQGISGIKVLLLKPALPQTSDVQGNFVFIGVDPGEQAVCLDEQFLPDDYQLTTSAVILISLTEGDQGYVEFGVRRIHEH